MGALDDCCDDCSCYSWRDFWWCVLRPRHRRRRRPHRHPRRRLRLRPPRRHHRRRRFPYPARARHHTPTTALAYNLSLTLTIRNPNWAMSMANTKPLDAAYRFDDQQFDRVRLAAEGDKHPAGKTRVYRLTSGAGAAAVSLGNAGEAEFRKENATGVFEVEVVVTGEVKYTARATKCKIEATCPLKLQLAPPGETPAALVFQQVKCKLAKAEKNC